METKIFAGKTAVVTGGSDGIGLAISNELASHGCNVAIYARRMPEGEAAAAQIAARRETNVRFYACDVSVQGQVIAAVSQTVRDFGGIDFLVNNAGIYPAQSLLDMDAAAFARVFDVNVKGMMLVTRAVAKQSMCPRKSGKIVSISSADGWLPTPGIAAYAASKAAVNSLVKSFAIELRDAGITSNGIAPGWVATEPVLRAGRWKAQMENVLNGRMADVHEVAALVSFLLEPRADYLNGEIINLSGGLILNA